MTSSTKHPQPRHGRPRFWHGGERTSGTDFGLSVFVFGLLAALYGLTVQTRMHGDGPGLGTFFARPEFEAGYNWVYLDLCHAVGYALRSLGERDPILPMKVLGVLAGALGGACTYLLARGFGATRAQSLLGTLLLGVAPGAWFYSTSVEVHVVHYAAVALCACLTLYAPWHWPGLALPLTVLLMPVLFFTHQSGAFLGLGWVFLVQYGRSRRAEPFPWWMVLLVVAPLLFFALLGCHGYTNFLRLGRWSLSNELNQAQIAIHPNPHGSLRMLLEGWLYPLFILIPAAVCGVFGSLRRWLPRVALLFLILPSTLFFLWWGLPERGGYILAVGPFYAVAAALALRVPGLAGWCGGLALLALQTSAGVVNLRSYDYGFDPAERVRVVDELVPAGGYLISFRELTPRIEVYLDDVTEYLAAPAMSEFHIRMREVHGDTLGEAELGRRLAYDVLKPGIDFALAQSSTVVVDVSYRRLYSLPVVAARRPYLEAFESMLAREYVLEEHPHEFWPLVKILQPR